VALGQLAPRFYDRHDLPALVSHPDHPAAIPVGSMCAAQTGQLKVAVTLALDRAQVVTERGGFGRLTPDPGHIEPEFRHLSPGGQIAGDSCG
jgi:hypothetical protein